MIDFRKAGHNHKTQSFFTPSFFTGLSFMIVLLVGQVPGFSQSRQIDSAGLHRPFDILLRLYVEGDRVDYDHFANMPEDVRRLSEYVDTLESQNLAGFTRDDSLAYWINLYNAATLELVLQHYPVKSIKDIDEPWERKVVEVSGKPLSLNEIENTIIRPQFKDARIHFALNCAAIGCPPLAKRAYIPDSLDAQLDAACRRALHDERWVQIGEKEIKVSKIFEWYRQDFVDDSGSIREFIARYRPEDREDLLDQNRELKFLNYNWKLNNVEI